MPAQLKGMETKTNIAIIPNTLSRHVPAQLKGIETRIQLANKILKSVDMCRPNSRELKRETGIVYPIFTGGRHVPAQLKGMETELSSKHTHLYPSVSRNRTAQLKGVETKGRNPRDIAYLVGRNRTAQLKGMETCNLLTAKVVNFLQVDMCLPNSRERKLIEDDLND